MLNIPFARSASAPVETINYTQQLNQVIEIAKLILTQVQDHAVTANVDLSSIATQLAQIIAQMQATANNGSINNDATKVLGDKLTAGFMAIVSSIDGFKSSTILELDGFLELFKQQNLVLQEEVAQLVAATQFSEMKLALDYSADILAENTLACTISIPEGAYQIQFIPYGSFAYLVNGEPFTDIIFGRESGSVGNKAITQLAHAIEIPAKQSGKLTYTAFRSIGTPVIVNGVSLNERVIQQVQNLTGEIGGALSDG